MIDGIASRRKAARRKSLTRHPVAPPPDPLALIRELNHRVKNNFQIIVSLMNLKKRTLPQERHGELRFIEEHVQSMSVAYRLVYATGAMNHVSVTELITEVLAGLRQIAGVSEDRMKIDQSGTDTTISLDHGIALALYLAVLLPPYLDEAAEKAGTVSVDIAIEDDDVTLAVGWSGFPRLQLDLLRGRLMRAYLAQIEARVLPARDHEAQRICFSAKHA